MSELSLWQYEHLSFIKLFLTLSYSRKQAKSFHLILQIPSLRLSASFDNEVALNFKLSVNVFLRDIVKTISFPSLSIFVTSLSIGTEKVLYFSVFFLRHSNCPSNSFANCFIIKW